LRGGCFSRRTRHLRPGQAGDRQRERFSKLDAKHPIFCNADMRVGEIRQFCKLQGEGQRLMQAAMSQLNLSARGYHRIPSTGSGQA
jgi:magnesium chelatase family protein